MPFGFVKCCICHKTGIERDFIKDPDFRYTLYYCSKECKAKADAANARMNAWNEMQAENWIKSGRVEQAAHYYDQMGDWEQKMGYFEKATHHFEKAGQLRAQAKVQTMVVKNTNVNVDLNSLLKQLSDGGIVAVYRCPQCGGNLKIDKNTNVSSIRTCQYCKSEITTKDIADFL